MKTAVLFILLIFIPLVSSYSGAIEQSQGGALHIVINENNYPCINLAPFYLYTKMDDSVQKETVDIVNMPFNKAFKLTKTVKHTDATKIQFSAKTKSPLKRGDLLMLNFYARKVQQNDQPEQSQLITIFEQSSSPWAKSLNVGVTLSPAWKKYSFPIRIKSSTNRDSSYRLTFRLGFDEQIIELANINLVNLPNDLNVSNIARTKLSYVGEESDADWRQHAQQRIDDIRKASMAITVLDKNGNTVNNAQIKINMTKHEFIFGTAINAYILDKENTPDSIKYLEAIKQNFNQIVLETTMKWSNWPKSKKQADQVVNWALYHGLTIRGHNIIWPSWSKSPWEENKAQITHFEKHPRYLEKEIAERVSQLVGRYKGLLDEWDVVNEPYTNNDFMGLLGYRSMIEWFKQTRALDPSSRLYINDYGILVNENNLDDKHLLEYEKTIQFLLDNQAPLKGIGMQGHFREVMTTPQNLLATLDQFSKFNLPIVLTEYDHASSDKELQARYLNDVLTVMFSHPAVTGFLMWGFWDGAHWENNAPIYNTDWSLKPSGKVYQSLVLDKWWTRLSGHTNKEGVYNNYGFLGDYSVLITSEGKPYEFSCALSKSANTFEFVIDP
jgi:GH35 family endo-1,4-beta-xylanase